MKTLVILVHPDIENSVISKRWKKELEKYPEKIRVHELYKEYPDFKIDIKKEQNLIEQYDNIIFQFPLYWYSSPSLLKEWLDVVLSPGWAYEGGDKLKNKNIGLAVSVGVAEKEYSITGAVEFSLETLLSPFITTIKYVKANLIPTYTIYDTVDIDINRLNQNAENYIKHIFSIK